MSQFSSYTNCAIDVADVDLVKNFVQIMVYFYVKIQTKKKYLKRYGRGGCFGLKGTFSA